MAYLMFAAVFVVVKSIQGDIAEHGGHITAKELLSNKEFATLIVSLVSTYILYFTMSFLFFDPWHMFTSFIQYLLLTPMYINILNVYAFCNTHDITWGTKGADTAAKLESVNVGKNNAVNVQIPTTDTDLNTQYEAELRTFATKYTVEKKKPGADERQEDYYKGFRSAVVLVWMFCNLGLAAAVLATGGFERLQSNPSSEQDNTAAPVGGGSTGQLIRRQQNSGSGAGLGSQTGTNSNGATSAEQIVNQNSIIYMQVILYSVAVLSLIRWVGSLWFLVLRLLRGV